MNEQAKKLQSIFKELGYQVELQYNQGYFEAFFNNKLIAQIKNDDTFEEATAKILGGIMQEQYRQLKRRVENKESFAGRCYRYLVGFVGKEIALGISRLSSRTKKAPKWVKDITKHENFSPLNGFDDTFVDHWFYTEDGAFVSEPYSLGLQALEHLMSYCKKHNLDVIILGKSAHFPGHTLRIELRPKQNQSKNEGGES